MSAAEYNYTHNKGAHWVPVFRWGSRTPTTKAITAITRAAPAVVTATAHGMPSGWPCAVVSAGGMTQINAEGYPPRLDQYKPGTVVDASQVSLDEVNSADFTAYTSGGYLVYPTPVDLSTVSAMVLTIYDNPELTGTALATLSVGTGIVLDNTAKTISATLATAALDWDVGYYELMATVAGIDTQILVGTLALVP
jgi:hypothetical protein